MRPVLAVLFRVAIGPRADRYAPRFLAFERAGFALPGWHWPSLLMPSLWAFYRKLWLPGVVFALLRLSAVALFVMLASRTGESDELWYVCGLLLVLIVPGILPAAVADWLLYRRVRSLVRRAEACSANATQAASWLNAHRPTSEVAALLLSFAVMCAGIATLGPALWSGYTEHIVRIKVADTLAAIRWVQGRVGEEIAEDLLLADVILAGDAAKLIEGINVSAISGRIRLDFGARVPELSGKSILLAPAQDHRERVRWLCIPVDIPAKYLPRICRDG